MAIHFATGIDIDVYSSNKGEINKSDYRIGFKSLDGIRNFLIGNGWLVLRTTRMYEVYSPPKKLGFDLDYVYHVRKELDLNIDLHRVLFNDSIVFINDLYKNYRLEDLDLSYAEQKKTKINIK